MRKLGASLFVLFLAVPVGAQSINVDFEPADSPFGLPTPNYGASAGTGGVWNSVGSAFVSGLRRWDGAVTGVSLQNNDNSPGCGTTANDAFFSFNSPGTSGEDEALLDDRYNPSASQALRLVFQGLDSGNYVVDTIIPRRFCIGGSGFRIRVTGSPDPEVVVAGTWNGSYVLGQNYARHSKTVTDGTITIEIDAVHFIDYVEVAGIQLRRGDQELPGHALCFGDASAAAPCPCANTGLPGRGCQNSAGTGGAVLFASGTTSPDTVVLHSSGERATALSIFLQGNASINPVTYGDGLRCTGGTLKRLYTKTASAGEAFAPGPGDPSITARSTALGVPIPANGRRYYQVWYRDGNPGFCAPPTGDSFNVSSAVRILW